MIYLTSMRDDPIRVSDTLKLTLSSIVIDVSGRPSATQTSVMPVPESL